ncbi:hypothetical protein KEM56_000326 [Ascosphaera pollenicola]|nr:hypothetical protein KEM56_000326 [Ascosphaera pollenicola]
MGVKIQLETQANGRTTPTMVIASDEPDSPDSDPETPTQTTPYGVSLLDPEDHSSMISARFDDDAMSIRSTRFPFLSDPDEDHSHHGNDPIMQPVDDTGVNYSQLVHVIDKNFRRELDARDAEVARMRVRLNDMDQVYRKELQQRTSEIDGLRSQLQHLQTATDRLLEKTKGETDAQWAKKAATMVEKARYQVEDSWEVRWKERDTVLLQKLRRLEDENDILRVTNLELIRRLADAEYKRGELDEKVHADIKGCV